MSGGSTITLHPARKRRAAALLASLAAAAAVLYLFPPDQYRLYPRCLLYSWTGFQCPACGGLRAAHHLLHGHLAEAFRLNAMLVLAVPLLVFLLAAHLMKAATGRDYLETWRRPFWLWLLLGAAVGFAIARNLPFGPLANLNS